MKAHVYNRNDINTDEIIPARYLNMDKEEDLAKHAMEDIDKDFVNKVANGDCIVAGENFGCGSSREHAIWALRGCGTKAVIANSFARIFYRNAINNGFLVIECKDANKKIDFGDELDIDVANGKVKNITKNEEFWFSPLPDFAINLMNKGGLLNSIKESLKRQ